MQFRGETDFLANDPPSHDDPYPIEPGFSQEETGVDPGSGQFFVGARLGRALIATELLKLLE